MVYTLITVLYTPKLLYGIYLNYRMGIYLNYRIMPILVFFFFLLFLALAHCFNLLIISELFFLYSFLFESNVLTYLH